MIRYQPLRRQQSVSTTSSPIAQQPMTIDDQKNSFNGKEAVKLAFIARLLLIPEMENHRLTGIISEFSIRLVKFI